MPWGELVIFTVTKPLFPGSNIHAREHNTGDYFWSKSKVMLSEIADVRLTTFGWNLIALHGKYGFANSDMQLSAA